MSFDIIPYEPDNTDQTATRQRTTPMIRAHRSHPYIRSAAVSRTPSQASGSVIMSPDDIDSVQGGSESNLKKKCIVPKLNMGDYSVEERFALEWIHEKIVMDMFSTTGWLPNVSREDKRNIHAYVVELVAQTNQKHGCSMYYIPAYASYWLTQTKTRYSSDGLRRCLCD